LAETQWQNDVRRRGEGGADVLVAELFVLAGFVV
jgi:hypothetical protein